MNGCCNIRGNQPHHDKHSPWLVMRNAPDEGEASLANCKPPRW